MNSIVQNLNYLAFATTGVCEPTRLDWASRVAKAYFHFHNYFAKQTRIHEEDGETGETSEDVFPENGRSGKAGIELRGSLDDLGK